MIVGNSVLGTKADSTIKGERSPGLFMRDEPPKRALPLPAGVWWPDFEDVMRWGYLRMAEALLMFRR